MKRSRILSLLVVIGLLTGLLAIILKPDDYTSDMPESGDIARAYQVLNDTLDGGRYTYLDYVSDLGERNTPDFSAAVSPRDGTATLADGAGAVYAVTIPADGWYTLTLSCRPAERSYFPLTLAAEINGTEPFFEARSLSVPIWWQDSTKDFPLDSYGDETIPRQSYIGEWQDLRLYNNTHLTDTPICFYLTAGENIISLSNMSSAALEMGKLTVENQRQLPSYADYRNAHRGTVYNAGTISLRATDYVRKNSTEIQLYADNNSDILHNDPKNRLINSIDIMEIGAQADFTVTVEQTGYYVFTLHGAMGDSDFARFLSLFVDGAPPFAEAASFALHPYNDMGWHYQTWTDAEGEPYLLWLEAGEHTLSLRSECRPVAQSLRDLQLMIDHLNQFSLDIKKITGREVDENRTWRLTKYLPETADILQAYDTLLRKVLHELAPYGIKGTAASFLSNLNEALVVLVRLREDPDKLPLYMDLLSGPSGSVLQLSGDMMDRLLSQGVSVSMMYLHAPEAELPRERAAWYKALSDQTQRVVESYVSPKYAVRNDEEALNIWVNYNIAQVAALQRLIDTRYTAEGGSRVKLSIMPDPYKLLLAVAAGTMPDMAMGVPSSVPYDLALRGAVADFTQFDDFWSMAQRFIPGTLTGYIFNEGIYAIPENCDFNIMVYRKDILDRLGLKVPDTWQDVAAMMSELQRFDMSFYYPIAGGDAYKYFYQTAPMVYQFGGELYQPDGLGTAIDQPKAIEGLTFLGELYTTYALAEQVPLFFNSFRYGETPIGVVGPDTYNLLRRAAPELAGQWGIAPYPGTVQDDGSLARWYVANGFGSMIFNGSERMDECWEFIKWFTDTEVQVELAADLQSTYGMLWFSANYEALRDAPMESSDRRMMLEAVQWMRDVPRSPGHYMLERALSDIWNTTVFDGTPPRVAIDEQIVDIQREFKRKMLEFGFIDEQGRQLKPYAVRELDWILEKLSEGGAAS